MRVAEVRDLARRRESERAQASQDAQDGLIEYIACMADVDLPEEVGEEGGGEGM